MWKGMSVLFMYLSLSLHAYGAACQKQVSWQQTQEALEKSIQDNRMLLLPYDVKCISLPSGKGSKSFGQVIFHYVWLETQYHHISTFLKRGISSPAQDQYQKLTHLCLKKLPQICGKYLHHRLNLYAENMLDSMFLH